MLANNVRIIEPVKKQVENDIFGVPKRKRVCAYCRVSTDSDEQLTSYKSQLKYYTEKIQSNPEWEFAGIYADEGITGTSMRKRKRYREMLDDCRAGKIDMILCKSVSRWARCTTDSLNVIEELTQLKIPVIFESDNLNSMSDEKSTKMRLTIESASAQDYSENLSRSVSWGRIRRIEQGIYQCQAIYGYRAVEGRSLAIYEPEAEVVRKIFRLYLDGESYVSIANILNSEGIIAPGKKNWNHSQIERMLVNEKYVGDLHLQKTRVSDIKYRKRVPNTEGKQYYVDNHHPAIIAREIWERVKREKEYRINQRGFGKNGKSVYTSKYAFSNRVYCLQCGSKFRRHYYNTKEGIVYTWVCINHKQKGNCSQTQVTEKSLEDAFLRIVNRFVEDKASFIETVIAPIKEILEQRNTANELADIENQIKGIQDKLTNMIRSSETMGSLEMQTQVQKLIGELDNLKMNRTDKERRIEREKHDLIRCDEITDYISESKVFETFDSYTFKRLVEKVLIEGKKATFVFNETLRVEEDLI